jgi:predicted DNA-binding transcriptional regulator AlpA
MPAIPDDSAKQSALPQVAASKKAATTKARNAAKAKATALRNMPGLSGDVRAAAAATCQKHDEQHVHGARAPPLRQWVRFKDLASAGIVSNWPTLLRLIADEAFPPGRYIGPNSRAWTVDEIEAWLESRPTGGRPDHRQKLTPRSRHDELRRMSGKSARST